MYMLLNISLKADRSNAARQEETPEQRLARLNIEVSIISILYNLMLFNITFFTLQADRSHLARQEETPEQRLARLDTEVTILSILYNFGYLLIITSFFSFRPVVPI
jgi:hypothetical protein